MPFQLGQSGNPGGRKKTKLYQDALLRVLMRDANDIPNGKTVLDQVASTQIGLALKGDTTAIKDIGDRLDGKPAQAIVGGDDDDNPVVIINRIERVLIDNANHRDSESIQTITATEPI